MAVGLKSAGDSDHSVTARPAGTAKWAVRSLGPSCAEATEWTARIEVLANIANEIQAEREELRNQIKAAIGHCKAGILPDGRAWKWPTVNRKAYSVKASEFRQLKLSKGA